MKIVIVIIYEFMISSEQLDIITKIWAEFEHISKLLARVKKRHLYKAERNMNTLAIKNVKRNPGSPVTLIVLKATSFNALFHQFTQAKFEIPICGIWEFRSRSLRIGFVQQYYCEFDSFWLSSVKHIGSIFNLILSIWSKSINLINVCLQ